MSVAILTDSNSGITQSQAPVLGVSVLPMPFYIDGETFYEDINLTQEQFYERLKDGADIHTSMPAVGDVTDRWDELLKTHNEVVYIPMSSGLSSSCQTALMLAEDYDGKVQVVNNQRISVTMRQSVLDAKELADRGNNALEIKEILENHKFDSSIYITLDTLNYLKKGGRITPAAAALASLLKIKPVLQIQGEKLDKFGQARTMKQAKKIMVEQILSDCRDRYKSVDNKDIYISLSYTDDTKMVELFKEEVQELFPEHDIHYDPLSLSISCHIGPGALAITATKRLPELDDVHTNLK